MKFLRKGPDSCLGHLQFVSEDFQLLAQQTRILHHIREVQFLPQPHSLGAPSPGSSTACHLSLCHLAAFYVSALECFRNCLSVHLALPYVKKSWKTPQIDTKSGWHRTVAVRGPQVIETQGGLIKQK